MNTTQVCGSTKLFFVKAGLLLLCCCSAATVFGQGSLQQQFKNIAQSIPGKTGVYATLIETSDTATLHGGDKFPMQSVYKFPIAMAILHEADEGRLQLDQKIRVLPSDILLHGHSPIKDKDPNGNVDYTVEQLLYYSVGESDGTACDVLLRLLGGPAKANAYIHALGVTGINIATTEQVQQGSNEMVQYRNWAKPAGLTQLLKLFYTGNALLPASKALLLKLMIASGPGAKRIKSLLPAGTVVAHKTGTAATVNNMTRATNDAGIITLPNGKHIAITIFIADSKASQEQRELVIARLAKAAYDHWNK